MPVRTLELNGDWLLKDYPHRHGDARAQSAVPPDGDGWMTARVPGDIHAVLAREGRIPDPYYGMNVNECAWTGERDWWYVKTFDVPAGFALSKTQLVFEGIDTYGEIFFNGEKVGETANMFRRYEFDVTALVRVGAPNTLLVKIGAPVPIVESFPHQKYFACFYVPRIFARKAQCQFSWDWAPHLPAIGIWQDVRLETYESGRIRNVAVRTRNSGHVSFFIELDERSERQDLDQKVSQKGEDEIRIPQGDLLVTISGQGRVVKKKVKVRGQKNHLTLRVDNPRLWWPAGMGEQPLYTYTVQLLRHGKVHHQASGRFGIREIELVEDVREEGGFGWRFEINGERVFCKGANWIPLDCFPAEVTPDRYRYSLTLAKEAHFNMLRVWGGGIYEKDVFYDLCDELGIMVWQDLMTACGDYPDDYPPFVDEYIEEVAFQCRRLRNHPSLVYWCGGNEKTGSAGFLVSYGDKLNHYIARGVIGDLDPTRPYRPASPHSYSDLGNDPDSGDTHAAVWEKAFERDVRTFRDVTDKVVTVFNSEFGVHGPCRYRSVNKFIPPELQWPVGECWELHLTDNPYNSLEETYVQTQVKMAERLFGPVHDVRSFIKHAMLVHAELLRNDLEHHRRRKWTNAGAMFWMFQDCWPCGTWAVVDYYGLPKPAYYYAKRACAPVAVSFRRNGKVYDVHVVNDLLSGFKGTLTVGQGRLVGAPLWRETFAIDVPRNDAAAVVEIPAASVAPGADSYLFAVLTYPGGEARNVWFHKLWHDVAWPDPQLRWTASPVKRKGGVYTATVTIKTVHFARCVNLITGEDLPTARFSDNFFDLMPGESARVIVAAEQPFDAKQLIVGHWLTEWE